MYYYHCHGLHIASEISLMLLPLTVSDNIDVTIHFGKVPDALSDVKTINPFFQLSASQFLLKIPHVANFFVSNGKEIIVSPKSDDLNNIAVFLYGSCFGALLKQRGMLTMHANAIAINDKAILIAGPQKAGKSTLSGAFLLEGYSIVSDDVCLVKIIEGVPMVFPGIPFIKLTQYSLLQLNEKKLSQRILNRVYEKYRISLEHQYITKPLPVSAFFSIGIHEKEHIVSHDLKGVKIVSSLVDNIYRSNYSTANILSQNFNDILKVIKKIACYEINRPATRFSAFELRSHVLNLSLAHCS